MTHTHGLQHITPHWSSWAACNIRGPQAQKQQLLGLLSDKNMMRGCRWVRSACLNSPARTHNMRLLLRLVAPAHSCNNGLQALEDMLLFTEGVSYHSCMFHCLCSCLQGITPDRGCTVTSGRTLVESQPCTAHSHTAILQIRHQHTEQ